MLTAYINGIAYQAQRDFYITEQSGNKTVSRIAVLVESQPTPLAGDIIELRDGATRLFWGVCGIPKSPKYQTGKEARIYTIECYNANAILANRIINVAYQEKTVTQIVNDIFDKYIAEEGISLGTISTVDISLEVYTAKDYNLQDALNELADLCSAVWHVSPDKTFSFIADQTFPAFPQEINADFLIGTDLQETTKDYKTRTVQYVSGATENTTTQTEQYTYDGSQGEFTTVFPVAKKPVIQINGVDVPTNQIGVTGLNNDDANMIFLFSFNSQTISYRDTTGALTAGDVVTFIYTGIFPIRVCVFNDERIAQIAELTGTSGKREFTAIASNLRSTADATQYANNLLAQFETYTGEVSLWLLSSQLYELGMTLDDTALLTTFTFNLPALGIVGDYVVVERKLEPYYAKLDNFEQKLKVSLRMADRNYLRSYGEILSDMRKDINQLSIREDDIVIQVSAPRETIAYAETMQYETNIQYYPTGDILYGGMFAPCTLGQDVYPT